MHEGTFNPGDKSTNAAFSPKDEVFIGNLLLDDGGVLVDEDGDAIIIDGGITVGDNIQTVSWNPGLQ